MTFYYISTLSVMDSTDDNDSTVEISPPPQPTKSFYRKHWLLFHLLDYVLIAISSFAMSLQFSIFRKRFGGFCPLNAVPIIVWDSGVYSILDKDKKLLRETVWGAESTCDFVFAVATLSFIVAFIWCWFFCLCSAGNKRNGSIIESTDQQWRVVPPALVFAILMSCLTFVNGCIISHGMHKFCNSVEKTVAISCSHASDSEWSYFTHLKGFYTDASWSIAEAWVAFVGWTMQAVILVLRCLEGPDYEYGKEC